METPHNPILEKSRDTKQHYNHIHQHNHNHNQQQQKHQVPPPPPTTTTSISPASPPSSSSSPSHEFSFTISLHSTTKTTTSSSSSNTKPSKLNKTNTINSSTTTTLVNAIDLSPADEIFFHGHLLPLHLLSHLPTISPRSSLDSFTLPITDFSSIAAPLPPPSSEPPPKPQGSFSVDSAVSPTTTTTTTTTSKPKSFSLFAKWKTNTRSNKSNEEEEEEEEEKRKRSARLDVMSRALRRYLRMVRPLLMLGGKSRRRRESGVRRQPHSFSASSNKDMLCKLNNRPGQYSAPASMRTSPSNSGLLVATPTSASDSTMEDLHAAIQAAIAHCKNSISTTTTTTTTHHHSSRTLS